MPRKAYKSHERREELAQALIEKRKNDPLWAYKPLPWQEKLHKAATTSKVAFICCANQIGKTTAGAAHVASVATEQYRWGKQKGEKVDGVIWVVALSLAKALFLRKDVLKFIDPKMVLRTPMHPEPAIELRNGNVIVFKSQEQGHAKFQSDRCDFVWIDEEYHLEEGREIFGELMVRLVKSDGTLLYTMTPTHGITWSENRVYRKAVNKEDGYTLVTANIWENCVTKGGYLTEEAIKNLESGCTAKEKEYKLYGRFTSFEGAVHADYISDDNFIELPPTHYADWDIFVGIDWGQADHPAAVVWMAKHPELERTHIFRVQMFKKMLIVDQAKEIMKQPEFGRVKVFAIDDTAQVKQEYIAAGVPVVSQRIDVQVRDNRFNTGLSTPCPEPIDGKMYPKLTIEKKLTDFRRNLEKLRLAPKKTVYAPYKHYKVNDDDCDAASFGYYWATQMHGGALDLGEDSFYSKAYGNSMNGDMFNPLDMVKSRRDISNPYAFNIGETIFS